MKILMKITLFFNKSISQFDKNYNYKLSKNIKNFNINLVDLKSRLNSFLEIQIKLPTDDLIKSYNF